MDLRERSSIIYTTGDCTIEVCPRGDKYIVMQAKMFGNEFADDKHLSLISRWVKANDGKLIYERS